MNPVIMFTLNETGEEWRKTENDRDRREIQGIKVKVQTKRKRRK
jgi:hypothetical protein